MVDVVFVASVPANGEEPAYTIVHRAQFDSLQGYNNLLQFMTDHGQGPYNTNEIGIVEGPNQMQDIRTEVPDPYELGGPYGITPRDEIPPDVWSPG